METILITQKCTKCKIDKLSSEFHQGKKKNGLAYWCKSCKSEHRRTRYKSDGDVERKKNLARNRRILYGVSEEVYKAMLDEQSHVCWLCGEPETNQQRGKVRELCVDHDHVTGKVRKLLCRSCNLMLGNAKENPELLRKAADYLEQY